MSLLADWARRLDPEAVVESATARWHREARTEQRLPDIHGDWRVIYYQGGRGSGKTRSGSSGLAEIIEADTDFDPPGEYGIIAPTYRDAWTVCVEGEAGILKALGTNAGEVKNGTSRTVEYAYRSYGQIGLRSGHVIYVDSADDGALRVQGKNLRAVWGDEIGLWKRWKVAWEESIRFAVRKGVSKIILTGTPKASRPARALVRRLIKASRGDDEEADGPVVLRRLRTIDNVANLAESFVRTVVGAAKGTRLERQELEGELLDDVANSLWTRETITNCQCPAVGAEGGPDYLTSVTMGVDPSDGSEESDEQAYTIVGLGPHRDQIYVVENWGGQEAPAPFARRFLIRAAELDATVVVEKNHGGQWMLDLIEQIQRDLLKTGVIKQRVKVRKIHASESKKTRAEPISGLYERKVVKHAGGPFVDLEDQMCIAVGELVTTARGEIPIEQVRIGDYALTRAGWRRVYRAGFTGLKPTVQIKTENGSVICTEDHPVYVAGCGFIRADEVQTGDTLISCHAPLSTRSSSSTARGTTGTRETVTTRPAAAEGVGCSIATSGKPSTARSRPAGTSTMAGSVETATTSATWLPCPPETTTAHTWLRKARAALSPNRSTSAARSAKRSGADANRVRTPAQSAATRTNRGRTSRRPTAPADAVTGPWGAVVQSVHVRGVRPVYDLSVEGQPEFFAGGLLVHNCTFTGAKDERSPDRLDSLVWACHPFLQMTFGPVQRALVAKWTRNGGELANAVPLERERGGDPIAAPEAEEEAAIPRGLRQRMRHEAAMGQGFGDIDDWGPQDAGDVPEHGAHGNVHSWSSSGSSPF